MPSAADMAAFAAAEAAMSASPSPAAPSFVSDDMTQIHARTGRRALTEAQTASAVATINEMFPLCEADRVVLSSGKDWHISESTRANAAATKARLLADKAWVQKYMDGDTGARKLMREISLRLSCQDVRPG